MLCDIVLKNFILYSDYTTRVIVFYFFLLTQQPPRTTLFPYTTLFRSGLAQRVAAELLEQRLREHQGHHRLGDEDRKSTRLNSSHVEISYAVFCLKKKNKADAISYQRASCFED